MAHHDGIITAPVGIDDVRAVLGTDATALRDLCAEGAINKWSRYKPVPSADPALRLTVADAYRGPVGDCGITTTVYTRLSALMGLHLGDGWQYNGYGGMAYAARLGDFDRYCHHAAAPVRGFSAPAYITADNNQVYTVALLEGLQQAVPGTTGTTADPGALTLAEIAVGNPATALSQMYLGVAVYTRTTGAIGAYDLVFARTDPHQGAMSAQITFKPSTAIAAGTTVYVLPFWSPRQVSSDLAAAMPGTFYIPPGCSAKAVTVGTDQQAGGLDTFTITAAGVAEIGIGGTRPGTLSHIEITVQLRHSGGHTYQRAIIELYDKSTGAVLASVDRGPVQLAAGVQAKIVERIYPTGTALPGVLTAPIAPGGSYTAACILDGGYRASADVMMPATLS